MNNHKLKSGFTALLLILFALGCNHSPTETASGGSGTEDGNSVAGIIFETDGTPAKSARISAVPIFYIPMSDFEGVVSTLTDSAGRFILSRLGAGSYNIEAASATDRGRSLISEVNISSGEHVLSPDTLKLPGELSIPVYSKMRTGDYFYLNGTTCFHQITADEIKHGIVRFDSIFSGAIPELFYSPFSDAQTQSALADSLRIPQNGSALIDTPFVARARHAAVAPVIDGLLTEYSGAMPIRLIKRNGSAICRLLYDDSALYVAYSVNDHCLNAAITAEDGEVWLDDCVGIFMDLDRNGGISSDISDFKFWVSAAGVKRDVRGLTGPIWNAAFQFSVKITGTLNQNSDTDIGFNVEMCIPWSVMGITSFNRVSRLGFDAVMFDNDGEHPSPAGAWANITGGDLNDPDGWGELVFQP